MSDLYDSLEDECDENKCATVSLGEKLDCADDTIQNGSPEKYSFYLKRKSDEDKNDSQFKNDGQTKSFLPKIKKDVSKKGVDSVRNIDIENQILNEQGLQLNKDGSITKSPRWEKEELPFITREYRNLQFQKRKTYSDSRKVLTANVQKKTIIKNEDELGSRKYHTPKGKEYSDKLINLNPSPSKPNQVKVFKRFASNDNMTDSMKEKLLQGQKDSPQKNSTAVIKNFSKANCGMFPSSDTSNVPKAGDQMKNFRFTHRLHKNSRCLESSQKQLKTSKSKVHSEFSDISITLLRPKLNYLDRHRLENGFNIFHLKQLNKKVESDTNRSNFGDSVVDELPDVSAGSVSCDNSARNDEEVFYQKLIERDKGLNQRSHLSARSEGPVYVGKLKNVLEERKNFYKTKNISKSKDIDLDIEVDNLVNAFKKYSHICPTNSSTSASKVELALKAKTYGYLANARNIFRLKAQSELRLNSTGKDEDLKITENTSLSKKASNPSRGNNALSKQNSTSIGIFPNVKGGAPRYLEKVPRGKKTLSKTKLPVVPSETQKK